MKVLILGHGGHGKGTFAELFCKYARLSSISSSLAALDDIWPALQLATGVETKEQAYADRHKHRDLWKALISLYNAYDKSALCRKVLKHYDVYDGMRCAEEFAASRHLFDMIIYVDAAGRVPPEPSMGIRFDADMFWVNNAKDIEYLDTQARCGAGYVLHCLHHGRPIC
jgi:hypothetical protein